MKNTGWEVEVSVRNIYGRELIYPENYEAEQFASLTGRKTLKRTDLETIKSLGFEIVLKSPKL